MKKLACVLVLAAVAAPAATAHRGPGYWSRAQMVERLDGARITVKGRKIRLDASTFTCGGMGRGWVKAGVRRWKHFRCVQPLFPPGRLAAPDALFRVHPLGRRRFVVSHARFARY